MRRLIRYIPRKTARKKPDPLLVPMHPELYTVLNETPPGNRKRPVTPDMAERYQRHQGIVSNLIQEHFECLRSDNNRGAQRGWNSPFRGRRIP